MKKENKSKKLPAGLEFDPAKTDFETQEFAMGDFVFLEGTQPAGLYYVRKGKIKLYKADKTGNEKILRYAEEGDFVGYTDLISGSKYSRSAAAVESTKLFFIPKKDFDDLWNSREVAMYFFSLTSTELNRSEEALVNGFDGSPVEDNEISNKTTDSDIINLRIDELMNLIGTSVNSFIRILSDLNTENVLSVKGKILSMQDDNRLAKIRHIQNQILTRTEH